MEKRYVTESEGIKAIVVEDTITFDDTDYTASYRLWYYSKHLWHVTISDEENCLVAEWDTILAIEDQIVDLHEKNKEKPLKEGDVYTCRAETDEGDFTIKLDGDGYFFVKGDDGQSLGMFFHQLNQLLAVVQEKKEELDAEYAEQQKEKQA